MYRSGIRIVTVMLVMCVLLAGCKKGPDEAANSSGQTQKSAIGKLSGSQVDMTPTDAGSRIVAKVGGEVVTSEMLENYLAIRPMPDYTQDVAKVIDGRLEELIINALLNREALRIKLNERPDVRYRIEQLLAQAVMEEMVNKPVREGEVTEADIQSFYNEHDHEFNRPAQRRLADIFVSKDAENAKSKAQEALAGAMAIEGKASGFGELIARYSDTPSDYPKGNTGYFDIEGRPIGLDPGLAREAFKLEKMGRICDHVVETPQGFHIIMLTSKRSAVGRPLEEVKAQIKQKIYRQRLEQAREDFIKRLKGNSAITIEQEALEEVYERTREKYPERTPGGDLLQ
jgi:peptidyl-prolyl cis-trans isomerase C